MKATITLIINILFFFQLQAQVPCEFDTTLPYYQEYSYKVIETHDQGIITAGISGYAQDHLNSDKQQLVIRKFNSCGDNLWKTKPENYLDSSGNITIFDLFEEGNGSLNCIVSYRKLKSLIFKQIKLDSNGNLLLINNIGDNFRDGNYLGFSFVNFTEKRNIFVMLKDSNSYYKYQLKVFDSTGLMTLNKDIKKTYQNFERNFWISKVSDSSFVFIVKENSQMVKLEYFDKDANLTDKDSFFTPANIELLGAFYSKDLSIIEIYGRSDSAFYFAQYNPETKGFIAKIIQDIDFNAQFATFLLIDNNKYLLSTRKKLYLLDSNLNIKWSNLLDFFNKPPNYAFINIDINLTSDNCILITGSGVYSWGIGKNDKASFLKKINIKRYVKSLTLTGPSKIDQKGASIQLTANFTPAEAENKSITLSLSDTGLASITQSGLLTAKTNGVITVTAHTTDGSNIYASKNVSISNQTLGIENITDQNSNISLYPNPFSKEITIAGNFSDSIRFELFEINGKLLYSETFSSNKHTIDKLDYLPSGIYLASISSKDEYRTYKLLKK